LWRREIVASLELVVRRLPATPFQPDDIHALRRASKKLRALVLLAPPRLEILARETRRHADTLRRALSGAREASVHRATLDKLDLAHAAAPLAALLQETAEKTGGAPAVPSRLSQDLSALVRDWSLCDTRGIDAAFLGESARSTYRRARKRSAGAKAARMHPLHRLRRTVVDHETHLLFLARLAPDLTASAGRAKKLRDALGAIHDLDTLVAHVRDHDPPAGAMPVLEQAAHEKRKHLVRKVRRHVDRLFARKPDAWARTALVTPD
jgi:hypothetical protein